MKIFLFINFLTIQNYMTFHLYSENKKVTTIIVCMKHSGNGSRLFC